MTLVTPIDLVGPGTVAVGPGGWLYAAVDEPGQVTVRRYGGDGTLDTGFGTDGTAIVDVPAAVGWDIFVDSDGVVVVGGVVGTGRHTAWATRSQSKGEVDTDFGLNGSVTLDSTEGSTADLMLASDVHATGDGYIGVVLTRSTDGDRVAVVFFDAGGPSRSTDRITTRSSPPRRSPCRTVRCWWRSQSTEGGVDTFHLTRFAPVQSPR